MPVAVVCAAAVLALGGLAVSAVFASLPVLAGPYIAQAAGAVPQLGSLGALLGPPAYAHVVSAYGWSAVLGVTVPVVAAGVGCAVAALRRP